MKILYTLSLIFLIIINQEKSKAQRNKQEDSPVQKPALIIGIVIEQMRYEHFYRYWDKFGDDGFKRLISGGTNCTNVVHNYLFAQPGTGHAGISTGTVPANHGIIAQYSYERLGEKLTYCTSDDDYKTIGNRSERGKMSPKKLSASTIGDEIKLSNNNASKVIAVSLRDCSSIFLAGHNADAAYWFDTETGNWITSSYYMQSLPIWVSLFNRKKFPDIYTDREWNTLFSIGRYTESIPDDNEFEKGYAGNLHVFPYNLKEIKETDKDYRIIRSTPYGNNLTKDFAIAAMVNENLGTDQATDLLMVSFSATAYLNDIFTEKSVELEDCYVRLDKNLAHFLNFTEAHLGFENVLVFLTSDQSATNSADFLSNARIPTGKFDPLTAGMLLQSYLKALYGNGKWVNAYIDQQFFLNRSLIEDSKIRLAEIQQKAAGFVIQMSGVSQAATSINLETVNYSNTVLAKIQNSYNQKYSGDILINLQPGWEQQHRFESNGQVMISLSPGFKQNQHVPLVWYGWKVKHKEIARRITISDIAPTISSMLRISFPNAATGNGIYEIVEDAR